MVKRCCLLILSLFILPSCAHRTHVVAQTPQLKAASASSRQLRQVNAFDRVQAQGQINLNLHTGYKKPQVILMGDPRDLAQVQTVVTGNTLSITVGMGYPRFGAINADIRGRFLNGVHYEGAGTIRGNQLNTRYLDLYINNPGTTQLAGAIGLQRLDVTGDGLVRIKGVSSPSLRIHLVGNPKVQLTGYVKLARLNIEGDAWLSLYWLKSDNLTIRARQGAKIQLAGIVNRLDVELWGMARFKGRYLRAQRSFVKTHDKSVAEMSAVKHQSSLATDASDIYYYNMPVTRDDFMVYDGSVLNMREWSQYDTQEMNRYHK